MSHHDELSRDIPQDITDELQLVMLELRLMRQNFATLLSDCADQLEGKSKRRVTFPRHLRAVAESLRASINPQNNNG